MELNNLQTYFFFFTSTNKDPDPDGNTPLLLKVPYAQNIVFHFKFTVTVSVKNPVSNLTFVSASSVKQLDSFITTELFHNPNIQNEDNVVVLGDFSPKSDNDVQLIDHEFSWNWKKPSTKSDFGYKTVLCFAEYDKREHTLQQLAKFTVWIEPEPLDISVYSPFLASPDTTPLSNIQMSPMAIPNLSTNNTTTTVNNNNKSLSYIGINNTSRAPGSPIFEGSSVAALQEISGSPRHIDNNNSGFGGELLPESIDKVLQKEKKSLPLVPRPDDDSTSQPEDGPLFRATIASLEKKTGNLKLKVKKLLKRSNSVHERQRALIEAYRSFYQALSDISETEVPAFQPLIHNYFAKTGYGQNGLVELLRQSSIEMNQMVIDPLRKLYDLEIKTFDIRKREFDDESSQYYSWLSRYLSMKQEAKGKKKLDSDSKYVEKRKAFELSRFDYYSYMQDLHGGRKQQEVIYRLALFAESESNRIISTSDRLQKFVKPELDFTITEVKNANKDWSRQRSEREVRRRALERSIISPSSESNGSSITPVDSTTTHYQHHQQPNDVEDLVKTPSHSGPPTLRVVTGGLNYSSPRSGLEPPLFSTTSYSQSQDDTTSNEDDDIYDYEQQNNSVILNDTNKSATSVMSSDISNRKEGLLWAMSKPGGINDPLSNLNKAGWHKFWVVLAQGKLCEYTNWKQQLEIHNYPINLKVACVREARNAERRFCFEVVTPNYKRVYQATSDDDMNSWIKAINNGISSSLEASGVVIPPSHSAPSMDTDIEQLKLNRRGGEYSEGLGDKLNRKISLHRTRSTTEVPHSPDVSNIKLLQMVQKLDPSNLVCGDCGATTKVEWMSINLLIIVCIDCCGIHRSLGSHISKIRSLTLDTISFTPELLELMLSVNNSKINKIWEAKADQASAAKKSPDFNRLSYITEKYVEKKYVNFSERPNAHLRKAVSDQDLIGVVAALASRANPNLTVSTPSSISRKNSNNNNNSNTTSSSSSSSTSVIPSPKKDEEESILLYSLHNAPSDAKTFPVTELLALNSASLPHLIPNWASPSVTSYLRRKSPKDTTIPVTKLEETSMSNDKKGHVGAKLQKRLSSGFSGTRNTS